MSEPSPKAYLTNAVSLHPSWGTWDNYLTNHCIIVEQYKGWTFYNDHSNCYYIVDPDGRVYRNLYGYKAQFVWNTQKEKIG